MIFCLVDLAGQGESLTVGKQETCGEALIRLLAEYDVDTVFGIPGVHTLDVYRASRTATCTTYFHDGDRERSDHAA